MTSITNLWSFFRWEINIVKPHPEALGSLKFLIVVVDYFTKWVKTEAVVVIFGKKIIKFVWKYIVYRFGLPHTIISDDGNQFVDNPFKSSFQEKGIKQNFTSVAHP